MQIVNEAVHLEHMDIYSDTKNWDNLDQNG